MGMIVRLLLKVHLLLFFQFVELVSIELFIFHYFFTLQSSLFGQFVQLWNLLLFLHHQLLHFVHLDLHCQYFCLFLSQFFLPLLRPFQLSHQFFGTSGGRCLNCGTRSTQLFLQCFNFSKVLPNKRVLWVFIDFRNVFDVSSPRRVPEGTHSLIVIVLGWRHTR